MMRTRWKLALAVGTIAPVGALAVPFVGMAHTADGNIECRKDVGVAWGVQWDNFPADNPARQDGKWPYVVKVDGNVVASGLLPGTDHSWSGDDGTPIDENLSPYANHVLTWDGTYPGTQGQDSSKACMKHYETTTTSTTVTVPPTEPTSPPTEPTTPPTEPTVPPTQPTVPGEPTTAAPTTTVASVTTDDCTVAASSTNSDGDHSCDAAVVTNGKKPSGALPATGSDVPQIFAVALCALAGGSALVFVARRRR